MTDDQRYAPIHPAEALVLSRVSAEIRERAQSVRLMVFDVDGVLTDGSLYYGENGEALKRFHAQVGHGLRLLQEAGIAIAFITGRSGPILARRAAELGIGAAELGIAEVVQGVRDKGAALTEMTQRLGISMNHVGFMGDDIIDLSAMQRANFAATVPHAPVYVAQAAHWVSTLSGGNGAARECCDLLLAAKGKLVTFLNSPGLLKSGVIQ